MRGKEDLNGRKSGRKRQIERRNRFVNLKMKSIYGILDIAPGKTD